MFVFLEPKSSTGRVDPNITLLSSVQVVIEKCGTVPHDEWLLSCIHAVAEQFVFSRRFSAKLRHVGLGFSLHDGALFQE